MRSLYQAVPANCFVTMHERSGFPRWPSIALFETSYRDKAIDMRDPTR